MPAVPEVRVVGYSEPPIRVVRGLAALCRLAEHPALRLALIGETPRAVMQAHVAGALPGEGAGLLLGEVLQDAETRQTLTVVRRAVPVDAAEAQLLRVTISAESVGQALQQAQADGAGGAWVTVGWFHSHPGLGRFAFLSPTDLETIGRCLPFPHQLSLVWGGDELDEFAVFASGPGRPEPMPASCWEVQNDECVAGLVAAAPAAPAAPSAAPPNEDGRPATAAEGASARPAGIPATPPQNDPRE